MARHVLTVNLRDDPLAIAEYRRHHQRVWPEVIDSLRAAGVSGMDIHLLGRTVVMIVDVADGLDIRRVFAAHQASSPRVAEWEHLMKSLQEPSPNAAPGEWWASMDQVFRFTEDGLGVRGPKP